MINATKKWIFLKISGALLVPLMLWFILNFIKIYDQDYLNFVSFFSNPLTKFLFSIFIVNAYFFSALSISSTSIERNPSLSVGKSETCSTTIALLTLMSDLNLS